MEWKVISELTLRRMKLEVSMHGGEISKDFSRATHLVVFSIGELDHVDMDLISRR